MQKDFEFDVNQFDRVAEKLQLPVDDLLSILISLKNINVITRIGPFLNMDRSNGYVSLAAMSVPEDKFSDVTQVVNSYVEVAHNYRRAHQLNMWFVIAGLTESEVLEKLNQIENRTSCKVYNFPKLQEFSLDLFLEV